MRPNPQETVDLVTFTEEILNGKLHFYAVINAFLLHVRFKILHKIYKVI